MSDAFLVSIEMIVCFLPKFILVFIKFMDLGILYQPYFLIMKLTVTVCDLFQYIFRMQFEKILFNVFTHIRGLYVCVSLCVLSSFDIVYYLLV